MRTRRWTVPALASAALLGSGLLMIAASAQRWWPACRSGSYDTETCLAIQSHRYDFTFPTDAWVPTGSSAQLAGLSMLALAMALGVLPSALSRRPRPLTWAVGGVLAAGFAVEGSQTLLSGLARDVVAVPDVLSGPARAIVLFWPLAAVMWWLVVVAGMDWRADNPWQLATVGVMVTASPPGVVIVGPALVGYSSYDASPWTEAAGGLLLILAAGLVWPAALRPMKPRRAPSTEQAMEPQEPTAAAAVS